MGDGGQKNEKIERMLVIKKNEKGKKEGRR